MITPFLFGGTAGGLKNSPIELLFGTINLWNKELRPKFKKERYKRLHPPDAYRQIVPPEVIYHPGKARVPDFYQIARAFADRFRPKIVALGHDVRESSPRLWQQVAEGLVDSGVEVINLGQISTDMLYFAVVHYQTDGGIIVSASHNPAEYNGMKLVRRRAAPISADTGLFDIRNAIENPTLSGKQKIHCHVIPEPVPFLDAYLKHLKSFTDLQKFSSKRIVINANSGLLGRLPSDC